MKHRIYFLGVILTLSLITGYLAPVIHAQEKLAGQSASIKSHHVMTRKDPRVTQLRKYLQKHNSPLAEHAEVFIQEADANRLDWKFIAAISGVESTFGKHIPPYSHNGWGWGVYGDNVIRFESWPDAIRTISSGIRTNYMNKWGATDIDSIGRIYAASPTWSVRVKYFMKQIDEYQEPTELAVLPISL